MAARRLGCASQGILSDAIAWEAIFKVENGRDENLFQWRVGFVLNDMATVEDAKKYITAKRIDEAQSQELWAPQFAAHPPTLPLTQTPGSAPWQYASQPPAPAAPPQPVTSGSQPAHGYVEGIDRISTSHLSFEFESVPEAPAAVPPTREISQRGGPRRHGHAHAHTPAIASPLSTVQSSSSMDAGAQPSALPPSQPQRGIYQPIAHANAPGSHHSTPLSTKNQSSATSAKAAGSSSRRRRLRANVL
ncbi:hypothetical protein NW754_013630 [Fusarium falciforme]|nr:hypothetical protein NW754_013630 [Fusarium falciforme]